MFLCICMSPAIDATVKLPRAPEGNGEIFKDVAEEENVGGKAINVARWLALRGAQVACGGLLGEDNDRPFVRELARYGIEDRFIRVPGATRRNEMIIWPGGSVKLNRPAFPGLGRPGAAESDGTAGTFWDLALSQSSHVSQMSQCNPSFRVAILSGSLPAALPRDFYAQAVAALKAKGWTTVLDASGEAMRLGLEARPDLIKPNAEECEPLVGFVPRTPEEFARATALLREKAAHVIISDGGAGAWFDGEFAAAPKVKVLDTTAAGDTLLAEYCWRVYGGDGRGKPCNEGAFPALWAVAAGSAACTMPGGAPPPPALVEELALRQAPAAG
jgi:1-phosphofructokinase